jgi:F0F1-type ATP synthase membrane subunit b/b'
MKTTSLIARVGLLTSLALSSACNSAGHQQADSTGMSMDNLRVAVVALKDKVSAAATSLAGVVEKADIDPKASFEQYNKDVTALTDALEKGESNLKSMRDQGQAYFAEWQKQAATISDPDLKKKAEERREKLSKAIAAVSDAMAEARTELVPYVKTNEDVRTYLKNDLTPEGIKSVADKSKQIGKDSKSIGKKIDEVVEALEKGAPEFKTAKPPPPPPETKS